MVSTSVNSRMPYGIYEYIVSYHRLRKRQYILVSKVKYQPDGYNKNMRMTVMALNYKKAQEEN